MSKWKRLVPKFGGVGKERAGRPVSIPGWSVALCGVMEVTGFADALLSIGSRTLGSVPDLGRSSLAWLAVLVGLLWVFLASRMEKQSARSDTADLRASLVGLIHKFEQFCLSYQSDPFTLAEQKKHETAVTFARDELSYAASQVLRDFLRSVPEPERWKYANMLRRVQLDYMQHHNRDPVSIPGRSVPPLKPIIEALRRPARDTEESPPR